jgi:hypothetical protein
MTEVKAMAATFTNISIEDIRKFLMGAFHALDPYEGKTSGGEITIDLPLSDKVAVKVFTSVHEGREQAAGVGADAIRVGLYRGNRPLKSGSWPIVKRTQGWKENLRERVEDMVEIYDSNEQIIESGAFFHWPAS